jgi:transposase
MEHPRDISDEKWQRLEPLLPPQKQKTGRPAHDHRPIVNTLTGTGGMLWFHRTGAPWRDMPERYGPWQTVSTRFYRWRKKGVWKRILEHLQEEADAKGEIDWESHYVDGSVMRAHQHAAGVKKGS